MIIYNVGGASVGDHKHLKRIKGLRARAGEAPLVVLSDNDSREEVLSALGAGAQGFLYAGTNAQLALQALSFIFKGGSYFPAAAQPRRRNAAPLNGTADLAGTAHLNGTTDLNRTARPNGTADLNGTARLNGTTEASSSPIEGTILDAGDGAEEDVAAAASTNINLTERQKSVLEHLGRGDSNKAIARLLGIREGHGQGSCSTNHAQARRGQPHAGRHCLCERHAAVAQIDRFGDLHSLRTGPASDVRDPAITGVTGRCRCDHSARDGMDTP